GRIHPDIAWAKLEALTQGAALASRHLGVSAGQCDTILDIALPSRPPSEWFRRPAIVSFMTPPRPVRGRLMSGASEALPARVDRALAAAHGPTLYASGKHPHEPARAAAAD